MSDINEQLRKDVKKLLIDVGWDMIPRPELAKIVSEWAGEPINHTTMLFAIHGVRQSKRYIKLLELMRDRLWKQLESDAA